MDDLNGNPQRTQTSLERLAEASTTLSTASDRNSLNGTKLLRQGWGLEEAARVVFGEI